MARFKQIDILRAVAVLLVMGNHMTPCPAEASPFFHQVTFIWAQGGWVGVDLFFVLSGFLVSGLLFREHEKHHELRLGHFLIRRGFKIYPPFWLLLGATLLVGLLLHKQMTWHAFASELLFVQNYGPALWNHTWSLAVEEHFYLLLAFGFFVLSRGRSPRPFRLIPVAFVSLALLCLMLRILVAHHAAFRLKTHLFPSHLRLDSLFFGVFLSYLFHHHPSKFLGIAGRFRYLLIGTGVMLLFPAFCLPRETTPFMYTYGFTLLYMGSGCLLVAALGFRARATRFATAVAYLGSHSYSVYLWHLPVAVWGTAVFARLLGQHYGWFAYVLIYLLGSLCFGMAISIFTEFPVLRFRDRFFPSRGNPMSTEVTKPHIRFGERQ